MSAVTIWKGVPYSVHRAQSSCATEASQALFPHNVAQRLWFGEKTVHVASGGVKLSKLGNSDIQHQRFVAL